MHVTGRCHCGKIAYEAELDPAGVSICHCSDCQMLTGSAYRVSVRVPAETFRMLSGEPKIYIKTAESGATRAHSFCADCGAPVYSSDVTSPKSYSLRVGCLDQRAELAPRKQIWCKSSMPWSRDLSAVPGIEKQ
ncbi:MAG: GFA family protein [Betaproteobacteria bacterium]|nr:GFA family protein [Betaproteobacteria bacterium]